MAAMPITYLKRAQPPVATHDAATAETVRTMLDAISAGGEPVAQAYAAELDGWHGPVVVAPETFARAEAALSEGVKQDIRFARDRVPDFARRQRDSMQEFSAELIPGLTVGQAEHGPDSPVWLITSSRALSEQVLAQAPSFIAALPELARQAAEAAWRDHAEVVLVDSRDEAVQVSDKYACEHVQVMARDLDWWLANLSNYGSLFLGEETTVAYGDKCSGPNHILPTRGAARYSGGLSVGKFIKTVTWQRLTRDASRTVGQVAARISRLEGMEGHARTGDVRLAKYFPEQTFDLGALGRYGG